MTSQEMELEEDRGSDGQDERRDTKRALGALESLTQEAEPSRTTLVDARKGFTELSRLAMLWTVRHCWPGGGDVRLQLL